MKSVSVEGGINQENVERTIESIKQVESALRWIAPVACSVVQVVKPEASGLCEMAAASLEALVLVSNEAIARYRQEPSGANAKEISDVLMRLRMAYSAMDGAYKGDPSKLEEIR